MKTYHFLNSLLYYYINILLIGFGIFFLLAGVELAFFNTDKEIENPILVFLMYGFFISLPIVLFSIFIFYIYYQIYPHYSVLKVENYWYVQVNSSYLRRYYWGIETTSEIFSASTFNNKDQAEIFLQEYINKKINPPIEIHEYKQKTKNGTDNL